MEHQLLTCEQVAEILNCNVDYVWRLVRRNEIDHTRFSRRMIRFTEEDVQRYISKHRSTSLIKKRGQEHTLPDPAE